MDKCPRQPGYKCDFCGQEYSDEQYCCDSRKDYLKANGEHEVGPPTEEQMRAEWKEFGGGIHGPVTETVTMTEERYFLLRLALYNSHGALVK